MGALMWLKVMLPLSVGFWADATLAAADHALFFTDPWRVAQFLFGWASALIDKAYVSWAPVKFSLLIFVLSRPEGEAKSRLLITYFLTVSTCTLAQYLLPSAGPIFYQQLGLGDRFAELPVHPWVETTREYLWQDYLRSGGKIGGGISAMPSVHVAVALWIALTVRSYFPRFEVIGFIYFFLILFGSVLLGWHYAVDGIAACLITSLAWILARVITRRSRARALNPALMVV
jgi:hypothetical protein